jgi:hypothetical protein
MNQQANGLRPAPIRGLPGYPAVRGRLAGGRAWTMFGSRKNPKPACPAVSHRRARGTCPINTGYTNGGGLSREKCLKMPQNPTCLSPVFVRGSSAPTHDGSHHFSRKNVCMFLETLYWAAHRSASWPSRKQHRCSGFVLQIRCPKAKL